MWFNNEAGFFLGKNKAVSALQFNSKLLPFPLEKSCRNEQSMTIDSFSITEDSIFYIKHV